MKSGSRRNRYQAVVLHTSKREARAAAKASPSSVTVATPEWRRRTYTRRIGTRVARQALHRTRSASSCFSSL